MCERHYGEEVCEEEAFANFQGPLLAEEVRMISPEAIKSVDWFTMMSLLTSISSSLPTIPKSFCSKDYSFGLIIHPIFI